jgi:hypothetical protein
MVVLSMMKTRTTTENEMNEKKKHLLPHPDAPTSATVLPDGIFNDSFLRT